jgi:hypothetical protein
MSEEQQKGAARPQANTAGTPKAGAPRAGKAAELLAKTARSRP